MKFKVDCMVSEAGLGILFASLHKNSEVYDINITPQESVNETKIPLDILNKPSNFIKKHPRSGDYTLEDVIMKYILDNKNRDIKYRELKAQAIKYDYSPYSTLGVVQRLKEKRKIRKVGSYRHHFYRLYDDSRPEPAENETQIA